MLKRVREELRHLIELHVRSHPGFRTEDLAKLIYQGVFGADHLLNDRRRFRREFLEEWEWVEKGERPEEPLFEPVDPLGRTYRLNLRPAKRLGADPEALVELLLGQPRKRGRREEFERRWETVVELAAEGEIPFSAEKLRAYGEMLRETGAIPRHSTSYNRANRPHYRIINDFYDPAVRKGLRDLGLL